MDSDNVKKESRGIEKEGKEEGRESWKRGAKGCWPRKKWIQKEKGLKSERKERRVWKE